MNQKKADRESTGNILLSVIIPVCNAKQDLRACLDAVLAQSLQELEVICTDVGSSDGSIGLLNRYKENDSRLRVLERAGVYDGTAMNAALDAAQGTYVQFLDPRSRVLPFSYEVLCRKAEKYGTDLLRYASLDYLAAEKNYVDIPENSLSKLSPGDFHRMVDFKKGSPLRKIRITPQNCLFRRSYLKENQVRFAELSAGGDLLFTGLALSHASCAMICRDRVLCTQTDLNGAGTDRRPAQNRCADLFAAVRQLAQQLQADGIDPDTQEDVLGDAFRTLFIRLKETLTGKNNKDRAIKEEVRNLVLSYTGPFRHLLARMYQESELAPGAAYTAGKPNYPRIMPRHEACAQPKVSVVVPVYNVEDYINEALNSLTMQTLSDMEFLLVNDGSADGSFAIMQEYAALDGRFRILDGPNGGYGKAMNRGMAQARGIYLGILEPDDFVPFEMFEKLYDAAAANHADFVKADFYKFSMGQNGQLRRRRQRLAPDFRYYNRVLCPIQEPEVFTFVINNWSGIYRVEFLRQWDICHNETPGASYQDNGLWFKIFCRAQRGYFLNHVFYYYRQDNPNASMNSTGKMYAITEEYRLILEWLKTDPALFEQVKAIFYMKKLNSFFITLYRLNRKLQPEYLRHMHDEFRDVYEAGGLDPSYQVGNTNWKRFTRIMEDPDGYLNNICVSVIMPVYNASRWVRRALDSLLGLNEIPFEVICVDDGSTDDSLEILREYEAEDERVRVITQKNAGAGAARNTGMAYAGGEYLLFLDADDFFDPRMLRFSYDKADSTDADIVVFRSDKYIEETGTYEHADYTIRQDLLPKTEPFAGEDIVTDIFKAFASYPWDKLFRAEFIREQNLRFQEQYATNDLLFVFSAILKAKRIVTMQTVLVHYRKGESTVTIGRNNGNWGCFYQALTALREQMSEWDLYERREQDFINYCLHSSLWNLTTLQGEAYHALYEKLKTEWFADLGITAHDMTYFYNREDWEKLQAVLSMDAESFLVWQILDLKDRQSRQKEHYEIRLDEMREQKNEINRKLQITYREKAERGVQIRRLKMSPYYRIRHKAGDVLRHLGLRR